MDISEKKKQEAVQYEVDAIHDICENIGPRESGTQKELDALVYLEKEMKDNKWIDSSSIEKFRVSRKALLGFSYIVGTLLIVGALLQVLWFVNPLAGRIAAIIGVSFAFISLMITAFQFLFYRKFVDWMFKKSDSHNLYCKYEPKGEVKKRIIFNGHIDSAYEWSLMKIKQNFMVAVIVIAFICAFAMIGLGIAAAIVPQMWMHIVMLCFAIPFIGLFFICNFNVVVPGANDNLTGCLNAVAVLKCLAESNIRLENTEVCCMLSGSEECGLRGADAFTKAHKKELQEVPTAILVFDTLRDLEFLTIYARDMTNMVKNDDDCVKLVDKAATKINHPLKHGGVPFGSSDAAAMSRNGVKAVCIAGQDPLYATYYHNTRDTADNLRPETLKVCLDLSLAAVEIFDKEGFGDSEK